jgi:hypothetical protein
MEELKAYARGSPGDSSGTAKKKRARNASTLGQSNAVRVFANWSRLNGALELDEQQSETFRECMTKQKKPTEALKAGAVLLQGLRRRS